MKDCKIYNCKVSFFYKLFQMSENCYDCTNCYGCDDDCKDCINCENCKFS